jgi:hypothetical protein
MQKWIIENGILVTRKRMTTENGIDDFGVPSNIPKWEIEDIYIVFRELSESENQSEFGHNPYDGKDKLKVQTSSAFDVRKNDIIEISTEYPLIYDYNEDSDYTYWKVWKKTNMQFDLGVGSAPFLYLKRVYSSDMMRSE